jgi:hypothetical protein
VTLVLRAYFDESGIHEGARICALGGYMASEERWRAFESEWNAIMNRYGVLRFHATDCNNARGEYEGWPREKIVAFMTEVVDALVHKPGQSLEMIGIGSAAVIEHYEAHVPESLKAGIEDPYYLCMEHCVQTAVARMRQFWPAGERVVIMFDRQEVFKGRARKRFEHYTKSRRYGPYVADMDYVDSSAEHPFAPLGPADLIAHEVARDVHRKFYDATRPRRRAFARLWSEGSVSAHFWDKDSFEELTKMTMYTVSSDEPLL